MIFTPAFRLYVSPMARPARKRVRQTGTRTRVLKHFMNVLYVILISSGLWLILIDYDWGAGKIGIREDHRHRRHPSQEDVIGRDLPLVVGVPHELNAGSRVLLTVEKPIVDVDREKGLRSAEE